MADGSTATCARFNLESTARAGHRRLGHLSACNDARCPKTTEAAPVTRGDLECPRYAWQAGQMRYAPDSAWNQQSSGTSGPWARVGTQRRPKSESRTGHWRLRRLSACNDAQRPKATGVAPMIRNDPECSFCTGQMSRGQYAPDTARGQARIRTSGIGRHCAQAASLASTAPLGQCRATGRAWRLELEGGPDESCG